MTSDEDVERTAHCDYCDSPVRPANPRDVPHICETCLLDIQVGERVAE